MDDATQRELKAEVQRYLASGEMLDQPDGEIGLTPSAQKAIDGYLYKWIRGLASLFIVVVTLAGFLGFKNLAVRAELTAKTAAESAEKTAEEAKVSLGTLKANLVMSEKALDALKKMTSDAQTNAALDADAIVAYFRADLESSKVRLDELYGTVVDGFSELQLSESEFRNQLKEKRAEWDAYDVVKEFRGVADKIAADPRILEFIQTRMTLNAMPVGSIVGWHKDFPGAPPRPPDGWVECNGPPDLNIYPELTDSKVDFSGVPNLNDPNKPGFINGYGGGAFLRGSTASGAFERDSTKIPNAAFTTGNTQGGHNHTLPGGDTGRPIDSTFQNGGNGRSFSISVSGGNHGHNITGGGDAETRPVNMSVVWIMRVK